MIRPRPASAAAALVLLCACASMPRSPEAEPPRNLELSGTRNTRDLGGYETSDGRRVRWGRLIRSDALDRLADGDVEALARRKLRTVIDFRTPAEREGSYDRLPDGAEIVHIPISYPSMDPDLIASRIVRGDAEEGYFFDLLQRANRSFALDHGPEVARFLETLARPGALPALFHCTHGKDRTGFASALVLELVGVPWPTVERDYLLSNLYLWDHTNRMARFIWLGSLFRISQDNARGLLGVRSDYILAAREAVLSDYGSVEAYVKAFGVSDEELRRLREALLE